MADDAEDSAPKGIAALPPTTVRQIGSHQLLTDPSSVVKELIDNALDARAKSIYVDIAANTIDSIQVKDDGHGIPNEDRALACRRYCTSKIRDFHDLKEVGGKWLGFRGEALASIADRNGELATTECDSHPVGTTVKVTKLLETAKVRKGLAIKGAAKCLAKIRRLLQAYALARPAVRFRLHILKAKNNKGDFVYAPKANANVEDAALRIVGKECALQCDWTALELDRFEVRAFMPKPTAVGSKIANYGAFIAIDSRPVACARGTLKKIAVAVRDRLRKANVALANIRDPFFCLNIICPVDSYDPNIEPAKDDVIFGDESFVLTMVDRLLVSYYPENMNAADPDEDLEDVAITQPNRTPEILESPSRPQNPFLIYEDIPGEGRKVSDSAAPSQPPRWSSSMYGIDEEDLEFLQENVADMPEEEDGRRDAAISNPRTIARMNAPIKPKKLVSNGQLLSPAKSSSSVSTAPHSPTPVATPRHRLFEPLTPQTPSQANAVSSQLDDELQQSIRRLPGPTSIDCSAVIPRSGPRIQRTLGLPSFEERMFSSMVQPAPQASTGESSFEGPEPPRHGGLNRTKSSTVPLNFIPHGFEIHNLTLNIRTSVSSIAQQARKLDGSANTIEWGYSSTEAFDTFRTPTNERKIMQWVIKIDNLLAEVFERRDVEIRGALHEGIQRFLDMRKSYDELAIERAIVHIDEIPGPTGKHGSRACDVPGPGSGLPSHSLTSDEADTSVRTRATSSDAVAGLKGDVAGGNAVVDTNDFDGDFDFEQFVDLGGDAAEQDSLEQVVKTEGDFGDGVDDEMLMDL
ncbi:hypothetical protein N0V87_000454 [Didymella glomerata]|uniref:DNA mismatch repair protein S5 domain-containing protein n=1 Tax=Didymella glomerata TaxID=749621 RepID=A0A9W9C473_9PLEO|nr:hypothetical protein N0V87_000454 [Didymella glomerata]